MDNFKLKKFENYLVNKYQSLSLQLSFDTKKKEIKIDRIVINQNDRNNGVGSAVLEEICEFADIYFTKLFLCADEIYGGELEKLIKFYQRFGFNRLPNIMDYDFMIRYPSKKFDIQKITDKLLVN